MNGQELIEKMKQGGAPPEGISTLALALWKAGSGDWHGAHDLCQDIPGKNGCWIHAWLHREEGDLGNAGYWYGRAGRETPPQSMGLREEWESIVMDLLG